MAGDAASVFSEWFDPALVAEATVYDGELGDMPVSLVIPGDADPKTLG